MISLCTVARYLNDRGHWKQADKVTELAEYGNTSVDTLHILQYFILFGFTDISVQAKILFWPNLFIEQFIK